VANCEPGTASKAQVGLFYLALYVIALGIGGVKPCLSALGGDQFDEDDEEKLERPMKRSFFNYWWLTVAGAGLISLTLLVYVEDRVSFGWGYGIPTVGFAVGLLIFLCGTPRYRLKRPSGSPLTQVAQVFVAAIRKFNVVVPSNALEFQEFDVYQNTSPGKRNLVHTDTLRFLDKAATDPTKYATKVAAAGVSKLHDEKTTSSDMNRDTNRDDHVFKEKLDLQQEELAVNMNANPWWLCSVTQVEEVKLLVRVIPVWFATLMFLIVVAQLSTFFLSQGNSMDLSMGPHFKIPAASLELFGSFTVLVAIPVYDLCFVPLVRRFTHNERGITMLQRMGIGLFISIFSMVAAALVEAKRLKAVHDHGLEDRPEETVPITVFWLIPQYSILALAQVFAYIGQLEFFYDQAPDSMQSLGTAFFTSNTGVAQFLSTALLHVVVRATGGDGHRSWIVANLNLCRIDKFYWLLAVMSAVNLLFYIAVAKWYVYKKTRSVSAGSSLPMVVVAAAAAEP
jgi:peptide/histidine transporter 3/4